MDDKLKRVLYPTNEDKYTEADIKEIICETVRQHIIKKNYKFNIDNYSIDLNPNSLSASYTSPDTKIEISNKEVVFETTRKTPKMYFVISKEAKEEYSKERNHIEIDGTITQKGNECKEEYTFTLFSTKDDNIKRYIQIGDGFNLVNNNNIGLDKMTIERKITKNSKYPNFISFFNTNSIRPVIFKDDSYYATTIKPKENYGDLLPDLEHEKDSIRIIYSTIIEYYDDYINRI